MAERGTILLLVLLGVSLIAAPSSAEIVSNSMVIDDIEYYMQTDDSVYNLGEDVEALFRVTNLGNETLSIGTSYPIIDIIVSEKEGEVFNEIWNWSWDQIYPHGPFLFELEPDESVELNGIWPQINLHGSVEPEDHTQVQTGIYRVSGYLAPTDTSVDVDITIVPEPATLLLLGLGAIRLRSRQAVVLRKR